MNISIKNWLTSDIQDVIRFLQSKDHFPTKINYEIVSDYSFTE